MNDKNTPTTPEEWKMLAVSAILAVICIIGTCDMSRLCRHIIDLVISSLH